MLRRSTEPADIIGKDPLPRLSRRKFIALFEVSGRGIHVKRFEQTLSGVPDLMLLALFDQQ